MFFSDDVLVFLFVFIPILIFFCLFVWLIVEVIRYLRRH